MEVVNLLKFLNSAKDLYSLDYATYNHELVNLLDMILEDEQFTQKVDLGLFFISPKTLDQFMVVDGLGRLLSLSLLLHALCECYKKTTPRNDAAIKTIREKYLVSANKTKLKLPQGIQEIYNKIIFGEKLSGREKESNLFILLHRYWSKIKEDKLQASTILKLLGKISVTIINSSNVPSRDLYYTLNKDKRKINQLLLIENYLKNIGIKVEWDNLKSIYNEIDADLNLFFKDFFVTKFNFKQYSTEKLYEIFINYFETMLQYMPEDVLMQKIIKTARLYKDILNVSINNEPIKKALIQIKLHSGEDTYAYILNIYEDFVDKNISETTFLEILNTIDEYLRNRLKTPNNVAFNELIQYLNAFITCKDL